MLAKRRTGKRKHALSQATSTSGFQRKKSLYAMSLLPKRSKLGGEANTTLEGGTYMLTISSHVPPLVTVSS